MQTQILKAAMIMIPAGLAAAEFHVPSKGDMTVTIPFAFAIGEKNMPAGDYTIHLNAAKNSLKLCEDGIECASIGMATIEVMGPIIGPSLIFERIGEQWNLVQVWSDTKSGYRVFGMEAELDTNWKHAEYTRIKARPLCIHQMVGLPPSWH